MQQSTIVGRQLKYVTIAAEVEWANTHFNCSVDIALGVLHMRHEADIYLLA